MAQYYANEQIEELRRGLVTLSRRCMNLQEKFLTRKFANPTAKEFAEHGVSRRLSTLVRCIHNTFATLPPELDAIPRNNAVNDAAIQVQAFVINVFGALDNLAWVWVKERDLRQENGAEVPPAWVGLREGNTFVRGSFSPAFQAYLTGIAAWFEYLENYRHALAHQIPLYIPPRAVTDANTPRYQELEKEIFGLRIRGEMQKGDELRMEQEELMFFRPFIMHSFQGARPVPFHVQMLADFATVEALSGKVLDELPARPEEEA